MIIDSRIGPQVQSYSATKNDNGPIMYGRSDGLTANEFYVGDRVSANVVYLRWVANRPWIRIGSLIKTLSRLHFKIFFYGVLESTEILENRAKLLLFLAFS